MQLCNLIHKLYSLLESSELKDEYLCSLIRGKGGKTVTGALSSLSFILFFEGLRSQPIFAFLLNSVMPLDNLICFFMGKWAVNNGDCLYSAVSNLAEIEALMCATQISFVCDVSSVPEIETSESFDDNAYFEGKDIGRWGLIRKRYIEYGTERSPQKWSRKGFTEMFEGSPKLVTMR